jgi:periplasmic divalent cation tolerance protein
MSQEYGIILVTASSQTEAEAIASTLVLEHLAACVNIHPIHSIYRWEGKINSDPEWQLVIKTKLNLFPLIAETIKAIHSYEVPEIIAIPIIHGSTAYLDWLASSLK